MKYLTWGAAGAVALVAIAFGIANREMVTLSLSPLPFALDMPLFVALELVLLVGFILGGAFAWARAGRSRRLARRRGRQVEELKREIERLEQRANQITESRARRRAVPAARGEAAPALEAKTPAAQGSGGSQAG